MLSFKNISIRKKILLSMLAFTLIPVILVAGIATMVSYRTMRDQLIYDHRMSSGWLQDRLSLERNLPYENTRQRVLTDSYEIRDGRRILSGRTLTNKPVYFESDADVGEFVYVKITKACPYHLLGEAER